MNPQFTEVPPTLETLAIAILEVGRQARYLLKETELDETRKRRLKDSENYEVEWVQVAATAIAALTDKRMRETGKQQTIVEQGIIEDVLRERERQDLLFDRTMPTDSDPLIRAAVVAEELAEVVAEVQIDGLPQT